MSRNSIPDWVPDWMPWSAQPEFHAVHDASGQSNASSPRQPKPVVLNDLGVETLPRSVAQPNDPSRDIKQVTKIIQVRPYPDRLVHRKLRGIHLFMITLNGTLGAGLYWRGGHALEVGGLVSLVVSFILVGALAWAVMQCIAEMLCLWPVPGALSVYVRTFVDDELGIVMGVAYWFTYSTSFATLLVIVADEVGLWTEEYKGIVSGLGIYFATPVVLVAINSIEVGIYGWIEVLFGTIKLAFLAFVVVSLSVIMARDGVDSDILRSSQSRGFDKSVASNWPTALLISTSIATYAYIGVEIIAASALEARGAKQHRTRAKSTLSNGHSPDQANPDEPTLIGRTVRFSAISFPFLAAGAYTLSSLLASFLIPRNHCRLPRLGWADKCKTSNQPSSVFVIIAGKSGIPGLEHIYNGIIVFAALTCASTNLYVASRSLFGLTTRLEGGSRQSLYLRILAQFGKTNTNRVPIRAVIASALAFCWVPFIQYFGNSSSTEFIEVLGQMSSVGVITVWACNCLAFIRFHHSMREHHEALERRSIPRADRDGNDYPYRSNGQPYLAYVAFAGCLFILLVSNCSLLWKGFQGEAFLSSYLFVLVFLALWVLLKIFRGGKWRLVDLSNPDKYVKTVRDLHDICYEASVTY